MRGVYTSVREITGKELHLVDVPGWVRQSDTAVEVPAGPGWDEWVVHEVCHWVVATDDMRTHSDNLGFGHSSDGYDGRILSRADAERQERMACRLEAILFVLAGDMAGLAQGCGPRRMAGPIPTDDRTWLMARADEVGWLRLIDFVRVVATARKRTRATLVPEVTGDG